MSPSDACSCIVHAMHGMDEGGKIDHALMLEKEKYHYFIIIIIIIIIFIIIFIIFIIIIIFLVFLGAVPLSGLTTTRPIIAENVMCFGNETHALQCNFTAPPVSPRCYDNSNAAGVQCIQGTYTFTVT